MRYYLDANLSPRIGRIVRAMNPNIDITSARELGHDAWSDPEQLRFATEEGRILITEDRKDFEPLAREWAQAGREYVGILLLPDSIANYAFDRVARAIVRCEREHPEGVPPFYFDFLRSDDP